MTTKRRHSSDSGSPENTGLPSARKRTVFWAVLLLIPISVFALLEISLRMMNYGGSLDLVVRTTVAGRDYYTLNREVGRRYFSQEGIAIPEAFDDLFRVTKLPGGRRIFMLGESTMAGFPFDYNATAPRLLQDRLRDTFGDSTVEVINVGLAAVNSYTVLDLIRELNAYEPDAFILYLGHNEFYGAFGVGSTEYLGRWRSLVNLYLRLEKFKIFLLMRDLVSGTQHLFTPAATPADASLMASMVRERIIRYGSPEYMTAKANYEANLREIISVARESGIPIVVSSLTSNVRDQAPLQAAFSPDTDPAGQARWREHVAAGDSARSRRDFRMALTSYQRAVAIDSSNADGVFRMATMFDSLGSFQEARTAYARARDCDALRFRASTDFNLLIRSMCEETGAPLADAERAFEESSPHGLVGNNLMLEHLHPNYDGYFLLAKTFERTLREHNILAGRETWKAHPPLPDDHYRATAGVTEFTLECAKVRTYALTHGWPFVPEQTTRPTFAPQNEIQRIALEYTGKRLAWSSAHTRLGEWFRERGEYQKAFDEYYALSKVAWYSYQPFMNMGDLARMMNRPAAAESLYLHSQRLQETPFVHVRLGMLYFELARYADAIARFESTVRLSEKTATGLGLKEISLARYFLGASYGKRGDLANAKMNLELAVGLDSSNTDARAMLAQLMATVQGTRR